MFRAKAGLNTTAWVLLFESSNHTEACSTSHVWMAPGDIFQHCASARDFVRIFVIWSKEKASKAIFMRICSNMTNFLARQLLVKSFV